MITMPGNMVQSQDTKPGRKADPDVKWNVRKQYDEHGNLIYYDSSCVQSWKHFNFRGPGGGQVFDNLDSVFGDFSHFPQDMFEDHLAFEPFSEFMDSLDLDFYLDSSIFNGSQSFTPFRGFPDSAWMDGFFDSYKEWIGRFKEDFTFPKDSLNHHHPKWQHLPQKQKKPARGIEI